MLGKFDDVALPLCSNQLSEKTTKVQTKEGIELLAMKRATQFVHELGTGCGLKATKKKLIPFS